MDRQESGGENRVGSRRGVPRALTFGLTGLVLISAIGIQQRLSAWQTPAPDASPPASGASGSAGQVHALARLEPASGLVVVGARPGARIDKIQVAQGDLVTPGQVLAILEGHDQAQAQIALAEAQKKRAEHQRSVQKQRLALEREQFDKLQAAKLQAAARVFGSRQRWSQIEGLYKQLAEDKTLPARDRLDIMLRYFQAENENLRGELEIKGYETAQQLVPRQRKLEDEELGDSTPDVALLDRQIELARTGVSQTEVTAPTGGRILAVLAHAGEVSSGPLLELGDLSVMVATAEVYQADVPRLRVGDPATARVLETDVVGKVTRIGSVVGKNQLMSLDPRALQDRRVVKVTIGLDSPELARLLVNMEVDVAIRPSAPGGPVATSAMTGDGR
jgi:HlyD family secretion protein